MKQRFFDETIRIPSDAEIQAYVEAGRRLRAETIQAWMATALKDIAGGIRAVIDAVFTPRRTSAHGVD